MFDWEGGKYRRITKDDVGQENLRITERLNLQKLRKNKRNELPPKRADY